MDLTNEFTPDEKVNATFSATAVMIEYMGTQKQFQEKMDKGINYLKWMVAFGVLLFIVYSGTQLYYALYPPPTEIERKLLMEQRESIKLQYEYLTIKGKKDSLFAAKNLLDGAKNIADALINVAALKEIAIQREQNAKEREDIALARTQFNELQKGSIRRDSLFNQKMTNAKTVNANKVGIINAKTVNVKKQ